MKCKSKELEWEKEFEKRFWDAYQEDELQYSDVKSFISSLLDKQRTELLEEFNQIIEDGFDRDFGTYDYKQIASKFISKVKKL